jgi:hypothetical protein
MLFNKLGAAHVNWCRVNENGNPEIWFVSNWIVEPSLSEWRVWMAPA